MLPEYVVTWYFCEDDYSKNHTYFENCRNEVYNRILKIAEELNLDVSNENDLEELNDVLEIYPIMERLDIPKLSAELLNHKEK